MTMHIARTTKRALKLATFDARHLIDETAIHESPGAIALIGIR
jgi:hypothetical protein